MFRKLSTLELNRATVDDYPNLKKLPLVVVLDNVRSQHNIGSAFRSSDAFLVEKIFLCGICAVPPTPEIHKSALGAEFTVQWQYYPETLTAVNELISQDYTIVSVEQTENSTSLEDFLPEEGRKYALVFGNEVKGIQQEVVDKSSLSLEIPQYGTKHSLNISVAIGIILWTFKSKLKI